MNEYNFKIPLRTIICILPMLSVLIVASILPLCNNYSFLFYSRYGLTSFLLCLSLLMIGQKKIISIPIVFYVFFALFQFGIPMVYASTPDYSNYYIGLIAENNLIKGARYTVLSLILIACSLLIVSTLKGTSKSNRLMIFSRYQIMSNYRLIRSIAAILILASGFIVIPLYAYVALTSLENGFSQTTRRLLASLPIFNLTRAFFVPSIFLYLSYCDEKHSCPKIYIYTLKLLIYYYCITSLIIGDRSEAICWILVNFYDIYNQKSRSSKRNGRFGALLFIIVLAVLAIIASYIANNRLGKNVSVTSVIQNGLLVRTVEEMGFNFISICFVMSYIPCRTPFQYGLTYLKALIGLIPDSLDFLGITKNILMPGMWMVKMNHQVYGSLLDFGTGFSFNAESYMNFSWGGLAIAFIFPFMLKNIFSKLGETATGWNRYVKLVMFAALITLPRRSFDEILSALEYQIFFIGIIIMLFGKILQRKKN